MKKQNENRTYNACLKGKVQTVTGLIEPDDLGFTLPHEHLFIDVSSYYTDPVDPKEKELAYQPITLENLYYHRYHRTSSRDSVVLNDEETAIREVKRFRNEGGKTIVELTPNNIGRNPNKIFRVARATDTNIIMGTAYYIEQSLSPETRMKTEEEIADEFLRDIIQGVESTNIRSGIIGEIGCSWPLAKVEKKVLRGAAIAQQRTGAAISIHPGAHKNAPLEIVKILADAGTIPSRIVIGHMERTFPISARSARKRLAETGCYLAFDSFGNEGHYPPFMLPYDLPSDRQRIDIIKELITEGYLKKILISHDICHKVALTSYGGPGFIYIPSIILPIMKEKGLSTEQIERITVKNPRDILTFE